MKTLKVEAVYLAAYETFEDVTADLPRFIGGGGGGGGGGAGVQSSANMPCSARLARLRAWPLQPAAKLGTKSNSGAAARTKSA